VKAEDVEQYLNINRMSCRSKFQTLITWPYEWHFWGHQKL